MSNYTTINIEKSILSSILFDANIINDIASLLQPADFSYEPHKHIYATMQQLHNDDYPIDETMIMQKNKSINHGVLVDILTANPVSNILSYVKELKKDAIQRQIHLITLSLSQNFDIKLIDKLQNLKDELENVDGIKQLKKTDEKLLSIFDKFDIDFEKVDNINFEYLIDNFLVKNEITMISAKPGTGKSLISVAVANMLLHNKTIEQLFYIDGDNSISTVKERNIHHLKKQHGNKFRYFVGLGKSELWQIVKTLQKMDLTNSLVVFDSIKNFITGDRDKNKDVSPVMEILKTLRNNGATVIFLHHQNKAQKDFEADYAGSSAFAEDTSNAFKLLRNDDKNAFILKPFKSRAGELHEIAFAYNAVNHSLIKLDLAFAKQTKEDEEVIQEIIDFISNARKEPTWSEIYNNLLELGFEKNKASKAIRDGENKIWVAKRGERNNQKLYSLIETDTKPVETIFEFEQNQKVNSGTPITSGSPFYGLSEVGNTINSSTDNSGSPFYGLSDSIEVVKSSMDNSDNLKTMSNFCRFEKIEMPKIAI